VKLCRLSDERVEEGGTRNVLGTQLTAAGSLTNSKPPTPPARVLGIVRLYSNSTIKMDQAALESRSIQLLIDKTSIPEAKMYVGGVRSTQDERMLLTTISDNRN